MKKTLLAALVLLAGGVSASAQDIITKKSGEDVKAKIMEVLPDAIKYKQYDYQDGPTFTMNKSEILMITYENGQREIVTASAAPAAVNNGASAPNGGRLYYANAATLPANAKYKQLKHYYHKENFDGKWDTDPYSPARCLWNLLLPGLGQMTMGEGGRGAGYLVSYALCEGLAITGSALVSTAGYGKYYDSGQATAGAVLLSVGSIAGFSIFLSSVFDAMRVAKIKDLYARDMQNLGMASVDFHLTPFVAPVRTGSGYQPAAGISLALNF
ncbi:MAG: hypothetical protein J5871_03985 [Bacteroidales bacterium]|nr:hypothetical protein [Bacteroidales bacterium]